MRWIKMFEEFSGDEIDQVMMSICDDMSFRLYSESDSARVYLVDGVPAVDRERWRDYLVGWRMVVVPEYSLLQYTSDPHIAGETVVSFWRGRRREDALAAARGWLDGKYGGLRRARDGEWEKYTDGENCYFKVQDYPPRVNVSHYWWEEICRFMSDCFGLTRSDAQGVFDSWLKSECGGEHPYFDEMMGLR